MKEFCESGVDKRVSFLLEVFTLKFLAVFSLVFTRESILDLNLLDKT